MDQLEKLSCVRTYTLVIPVGFEPLIFCDIRTNRVDSSRNAAYNHFYFLPVLYINCLSFIVTVVVLDIGDEIVWSNADCFPCTFISTEFSPKTNAVLTGIREKREKD